MNLNSKWYHRMLVIANKATKIPGIKTLLKPIYYPFKQHIEQVQRNKFLQNGLVVLELFDRCMEENNIEYTLAFGTLLGAVREKGFIKHDLDIDVYVWNQQYSEKLVSILHSAGFERIHAFEVDGGRLGREETYHCQGVAIDIFYLYDDGDQWPYCCDFGTMDGCATFMQCMRKYGYVTVRKISLPIDHHRMRVPFESIKMYIPANAEQILTFRYREDYMIPNPKWNINSYNKHIVDWSEQKAIYHEW